MSENEDVLPQFPALSQCLLIDSRHGSRRIIYKDLDTVALFQITVEATSIVDGLTRLRDVEFDACFFGPSLTPARAVQCIQDALKSRKSKDCAIIAVLDEQNAAARSLLETSGAHGVVIQQPSFAS